MVEAEEVIAIGRLAVLEVQAPAAEATALRQDDAVRTKLAVINQQLFEKLEPYRNKHSRLYHNEGLHTLFFIVCAICGVLAFAFPDPPLSIVCGLGAVLGLCLFLFVSVKGYSSFELA